MTARFIPSNAGRGLQISKLETFREKLETALRPHFRGKTAEKRLQKALKDSIEAIASLIGEDPNNPKGGAVMTEAASMQNPITNQYSVAPKQV